ncbi:MAG: CDP-diacylglycerol--glycerol-3-phosphate 3-phosphatidyltransferase [Fibrobacteria bacterium]|nr:CDP-diacylglycerol--glycerol-3-phosphate 3-phosphatidyltransferase [Fibrobacteria bacterium]
MNIVRRWNLPVQIALALLWIPVIGLVPFQGDREAAVLVAFMLVVRLSLRQFVPSTRLGNLPKFWVGAAERLGLLTALWFLAQRLMVDEWEPFPWLLTALAVALGIRYVLGFVFILSRHRAKLPPLRRDIWQGLAHLSVFVTLLSEILDLRPWDSLATGLSLLLCAVSSLTFTLRHLRDPNTRSHLTAATQITLSRIILAPVFIAVFFYDGDASFSNNHLVFQILALLMAISSAVTDWLDGHVARKYGQVTTLGKYLDPWSDKVATMTMFLCFLGSGWASVTIVALIFYRESAVETLRTLAAGEGEVIAARRSGKWKTGIQIGVTIAILVFGCADGILRDLHIQWEPWRVFWSIAPRSLMWIVALVTVASGVEYFMASRKLLARYF